MFKWSWFICRYYPSMCLKGKAQSGQPVSWQREAGVQCYTHLYDKRCFKNMHLLKSLAFENKDYGSHPRCTCIYCCNWSAS
jgi:hypothetical protein